MAVKVQYADIEEIVHTDLRNMRRACVVYEWFDTEPLELLPLLTELTTHLGYELDFEREADSAERVSELFAENEHVKIPAVHREWSTRRVLVMERVSGMKITDVEAIRACGIDPADVVQDLMDAYVRMILAAGFFQADPHPGNLMLTKERELILLDFGLSKELPKGYGLGLFELMFSLMTQNESAMIRAFQELGFETRTGRHRTPSWPSRRRMLSRSDSGAFEGEFTEEMTGELFDAIRENPVVRVPSDFVLVGRVFSFLSGIAHSLGRPRQRACGHGRRATGVAGPTGRASRQAARGTRVRACHRDRCGRQLRRTSGAGRRGRGFRRRRGGRRHARRRACSRSTYRGAASTSCTRTRSRATRSGFRPAARSTRSSPRWRCSASSPTARTGA